MTTIILKNPISLEQQHQMNALFDAWTEEKMTIIKSQLLTWAAEQDMDTDFDNPLQGLLLLPRLPPPTFVRKFNAGQTGQKIISVLNCLQNGT